MKYLTVAHQPVPIEQEHCYGFLSPCRVVRSCCTIDSASVPRRIASVGFQVCQYRFGHGRWRRKLEGDSMHLAASLRPIGKTACAVSAGRYGAVLILDRLGLCDTARQRAPSKSSALARVRELPYSELLYSAGLWAGARAGRRLTVRRPMLDSIHHGRRRHCE